MTTALDRRKFLKHAGMGTVVLAGAPRVGGDGGVARNGGRRAGHRILLFCTGHRGQSGGLVSQWGCGHFDENKRHITGNGEFVHYDGRPSAPIPKPIKATGLWEPRRLLSFHAIGLFGTNNAGILVAGVVLFKQAPEPEQVIPARLTVVCNIPQAALFTGEDEGFQLVVDGLSFMPVKPTVGISGFSRSLADYPKSLTPKAVDGRQTVASIPWCE
jgi:hypothetical protein